MAPLLSSASSSSSRHRLRATLGKARRRAAVVTSAGLLAAGVGVTMGRTPVPAVSDAPAVAVAVAPSETETPPPTTLLPPTIPVSDVRGESLGSGTASYYGAELAGNPTASGERFDPAELTAAHRTLPFGTRVRVTNASTGESVVVRINDRGPFHDDRVIDVSTAAAEAIGLKRAGTGTVELERLSTAARG